MSRNYDNWERLVKAVLKRDQIWQLCHQNSISSSLFSDDSTNFESSHRFSDVKPLAATAPPAPISLDRLSISRTFMFTPQLSGGDGTTKIAILLQDVRVSGKNCFLKGSKAAIKRLPETVKVTKQKFKQLMILLGNCRHENVGQPLAYYFSKERKLIVYDHFSQGSVSDILHGDGSRPDWESRLNIAVGAARGIAHIHAQRGGTLAHGNIKSSNTFLNSKRYGCVSDFGLADILERSREESGKGDDQLKPLQMIDVYNFGLLLLELVSRRKPSEKMVEYFTTKPYYEWRSLYRIALYNRRRLDNFDSSNRIFVDELEMELDRNSRLTFLYLDINISSVHHEDLHGLHKTLQVARRCMETNPEDRPAMSDVVLMLQNIPKRRIS